MIDQWTVFEAELHSSALYDNPFWDVDLQVRFSGPNGEQQVVDAFWDGGMIWRVRFSPTATGIWRWESVCSDTANSGLHGRSGMFECTVYDGSNALYRRGPLKRSASRKHFIYADDTPFFWLADTAWNGVLLSQPDDWETYLAARQRQGFTVIQFVTTQWRGSTQGDALGEPAFTGTDRIGINPAFFQRADPKVAAINAHGLIAAPVMLWTLTDIDPGQTLSEAAAIRLARYEQARWGAYQVVWLLGGDGCYERSGLIDKFKAIGRAVFADRHDRLVTLHPCGVTWVGEQFRTEPWFDFIGYQSGHGDSAEDVDWLVQGPPARNWSQQPILPVINLEPNYEGHPAYHSKQHFTDYHVRRAAYWSLLVSPPAGVTYGNNEIWVWRAEPGPAENHPNIGTVQPWHAGLEMAGIDSMTVLRRFFAHVRWPELEPAPELLAHQPGAADPNQFIAAAHTTDGTLAVLYLPTGGTVTLNRAFQRMRWFDPRTGAWLDAHGLTAPDHQDWLLVLS
jgi:hypothetical protein